MNVESLFDASRCCNLRLLHPSSHPSSPSAHLVCLFVSFLAVVSFDTHVVVGLDAQLDLGPIPGRV